MQPTLPNFKTTKSEAILIGRIVARAKGMESQPFDGMTAHMDLSACIANGCPLKLEEMLAADDFNFAHDFWGIRNHINRTNGQLEDCFVPRFAR